MLQMLWVLPELAPIKASSIPKTSNIGRKREPAFVQLHKYVSARLLFAEIQTNSCDTEVLVETAAC